MVQNRAQPQPLAKSMYKQKLDQVTAVPPRFTTVTRQRCQIERDSFQSTRTVEHAPEGLAPTSQDTLYNLDMSIVLCVMPLYDNT